MAAGELNATRIITAVRRTDFLMETSCLLIAALLACNLGLSKNTVMEIVKQEAATA